MDTTNKFYLQTWFIALMFAFWFIFGIPLIIGVILLIIKQKNDKKLVQELEHLHSTNIYYEQFLTPEIRRAMNIQQHIQQLSFEKESLDTTISSLNEQISQLDSTILSKRDEINELNNAISIQANISALKEELSRLDSSINTKKKKIVQLDEEILVQEFGLYKPQFEFATSLDYKEELAKIRFRQKELIKNHQAAYGSTSWTVDGSYPKGRKMVSDTIKLLLRVFNIECDEIISKVKYTNFDASLNHIYKSAESISKLGSIMSIYISNSYIDAKIKELRLAFEYQQKKQEEKEAAKAAREEQKEQAKVQRELEEQRKRIEKEQTHYQTAYSNLVKQLQAEPENIDLLEKKAKMDTKLEDINKALLDIDYREANMKAGYVYVISNIGAFGENVYKIGMTRRLDPQERVDELGDASVPFKFDVHAMIFSDDAPALEAALHHAFEDKKLNMVNKRREFFNVTLDEIKDVIKKNYDKTVEFIDIPDAEQYRISLKMKNSL